MKITINKNQLSIHPEHFLRQTGYALIRDRHTGRDSFVRRLGSYHYPRLHMYVDHNENSYIFNLHLDQKQASYQGSHAHNAEYEGEVVEQEINRLKSELQKYMGEKSETEANNDNVDTINKISKGDFEKDSRKEQGNPSTNSGQGKGWWKKLFS